MLLLVVTRMSNNLMSHTAGSRSTGRGCNLHRVQDGNPRGAGARMLTKRAAMPGVASSQVHTWVEVVQERLGKGGCQAVTGGAVVLSDTQVSAHGLGEEALKSSSCPHFLGAPC